MSGFVLNVLNFSLFPELSVQLSERVMVEVAVAVQSASTAFK